MESPGFFDPNFRKVFDPQAISERTKEATEELVAFLAHQPPPEDIAALRHAYERGLVGPPAQTKSDDAKTFFIEGPAAAISLRVLMPPAEAKGAYLHIHGGGWTAGTNDMQDEMLQALGRSTGLIVISVNYRFVPENPFPAPVDDCVAAAEWLIANAESEFGVNWLAIGGESAGAHLAAATLLRLRDSGTVSAFSAANLTFGCYDLSLTPSVRHAADAAVVNRDALTHICSVAVGSGDPRDPKISPLYADLATLPPALFSVGTLDAFIDDSMFMYTRWIAAQNYAELAVYPGGIHGFNYLDCDIAEAWQLRIGQFLNNIRTSNP